MNSYFNPLGGKDRGKTIKDVFEIRFSSRDASKIVKIHQLAAKIENTRYLIKKLFQVMEMEDDKKKDYELARTGITNE